MGAAAVGTPSTRAGASNSQLADDEGDADADAADNNNDDEQEDEDAYKKVSVCVCVVCVQADEYASKMNASVCV